MFVSFLLPKIDRGAGPLYHWVMLAQMSRFRPDEIVFLGDEQYFDESVVPFGETLQISGFRFRCPDKEEFASYQKVSLDSARLDSLYDHDRSHLDVFREVLCEPQQVLIECIEDGLSKLRGGAGGEVEAFLSWCNCPSLGRVAEARGVPVIHNELGPLRLPLYHNTAYFDFEGVNGNTSASRWVDSHWLSEQMRGAELLEPDALRGLLVRDVPRAQDCIGSSERFRIGVALQVQDDSNCIAFNQGWNELRLIYDAITRCPPDQVLIRPHPHARFVYHGGLGVTDSSSDSLEFLGKIDRLLAINSSVLAEAALWGVPFEAKGDSPVVRLGQGGPDGELIAPADRTLWMNAFFLAYLVPAEALFDRDYYRWRLAAPRTLGECHQRHLQYLDASKRVQLPALAASMDVDESRHSPVRMPAAWTQQASLDARATRAELELSRLHEEIRQAGSRYEQLEKGYVERGDRCVELETRCGALELDHRALQDELAALKDHNRQLEEDHRAFVDANGDRQDRCLELEKECRDLQQRNSDLQGEQAELKERNGELEEKLAALAKTHAELHIRCSQLDEQCKGLRATHGDLQREHAGVVARHEQLKREYGSLEAGHADLDRRYTDLKGQHGELQKSQIELQGSYALLENRLAAERSWRSEAERIWDEHEWMRNRVGDLERSMGQSQGQLEAVNRERDNLVNELNKLRQSRDELIQHCAVTDQRRREMEAELAEIEGKYAGVEIQLSKLKEQLHNMPLSLRDRLRGRLSHLF
ncbi:MAG: GT99 family glycosyltransferase N-terminal domain-containing protein [Rhodanobacter sp.]